MIVGSGFLLLFLLLIAVWHAVVQPWYQLVGSWN